MVLGMQIGHQRARLGPRYAASHEAKLIDGSAARLSTAITLAYAVPNQRVSPLGAAPVVDESEEEVDEPSDDDIEVEEAYGRWGNEEDQ